MQVGEKLHRKLITILQQAGFQLLHEQKSPFEALIYKGKSAGNQADEIEFHSVEGIPSCLMASAISKEGMRLRTIKGLKPNWSIHDDRWVYSNETEIESCLDEIALLVKDYLLPWFAQPWQVDAVEIIQPQPDQSHAKQEMIDHIRERITTLQLAIQTAHKSGDTSAEERYKIALEEEQNRLSDLS
jgi:hypothetical protein